MNDAHAVVRRFLAELSAGRVPEEMLDADMTAWTITSGDADRGRYVAGVTLFLAMFPAGLTYTIQTMTAEADRVAVQARGHGELVNGVEYRNDYAFVFRLRGDRIAAIAEYTNALIIREQIAPLMQAALAGSRP